MSKKYRHPLRWGLSVFALTASAGIGLGAGIDAIDDSDKPYPVHGSVPSAAQVEEIRGRIDEAEHNLQRHKNEMGATCLRLLEFYMPYGSLANTTEEVVVADIMQAPDKPCGPTITETRAAFRGLLKVSTELHSRRGSLSQAEFQLNSSQRNAQQLEEYNPSVQEGALNGGMMAGGAGIVAGLLVGFYLDERNDYF